MTRTEAAKTIALAVRVKARRTETAITLSMCEEMVSEYRNAYYAGSVNNAAANIANPKTVFRFATQYEL